MAAVNLLVIGLVKIVCLLYGWFTSFVDNLYKNLMLYIIHIIGLISFKVKDECKFRKYLNTEVPFVKSILYVQKDSVCSSKCDS